MTIPQEISLREAAMHDRAPNLLLLEDDARFAELVRHVLADSAPEFRIEHVGRLSTAMARLARQSYDLILTDLDVPDSHGSATVRHLQRAAPNVPLVVLSGDGDLEVALECIREGADEFLVKGTLGFQALGRLIRLALERRQRMMALEETADRTTLESIGAHLLRVADRTGLHVSVLLLKVDRPGIGDSPDRTEEITALLRRTLRRCDVVARLQGSEWAVVLVMQQSDSRRAATRLTEALVAAAAGTRIQLGVASYHPEGSETVDDLIAQARRDMHAVRA
jgi:DNA-binding NarL/FixJ family response regulator